MIRTYWLLAVAVLILAAAAEFRSPGAAIVAVALGFIWWDSGGEQ